jgi:hypothetical protein
MYPVRSVSTLAVIIAAAGATGANAAVRVGAALQIERDVAGSLSLGKTWSKKIVGDDVYQDEFLRTKAESTGTFTLIDETLIELGPSAETKIDSTVFDQSRFQKLTASVEGGAMRWTSGTSKSSAYRISTSKVYITVRGTTFDLLVEPQRTWVILEAGEIEVCTVDAPRRCKTLSRSGDTLLAVSGDLVGPSRDGPSDFQALCLSAGSACVIPVNQPPPPSSNPSRGGQRRADRTPGPGPTGHETSLAVNTPRVVPYQPPLLHRSQNSPYHEVRVPPPGYGDAGKIVGGGRHHVDMVAYPGGVVAGIAGAVGIGSAWGGRRGGFGGGNAGAGVPKGGMGGFDGSNAGAGVPKSGMGGFGYGNSGKIFGGNPAGGMVARSVGNAGAVGIRSGGNAGAGLPR